MATIGMVTIFMCLSSSAFAALRVNVMPSGFNSKVNSWDSYPYTWPGNNLELWGNVVYDGAGTLTYTWNFGAGEGSANGSVSNRNNIAANHTYAGTGSFIATLTVTDGVESDTDTLRIDVVPVTQEVRVNLAIQRALKYLYMTKTATTVNSVTVVYWTGTSYCARAYAITALAVLAFEDFGHREINDPNLDIYAETVKLGLNYVFSSLNYTPTSNTPMTYSDINGNGRMVYCAGYNQMYENGIIPMAIANSATPNAVVSNAANTNISGRTYREIMEDMVDYIAFAQQDSGSGVGGWRYTANYGSSDNSVTQWPVLGLAAAASTPWNIDSNAAYPNYPAWINTRLPNWIAYSQNTSSGGFGYSYSGDTVNMAKTGAGVIELAYTGIGSQILTATTTRLQGAINFLNNNWGATATSYANLGDHYAMYAIKKGMQYAGLSMVGAHDWQQEYNTWYVNNQINAGTNGIYWPNDTWVILGAQATTAFGLLVMSPGLVELPPVAEAGGNQEVSQNVPVKFNGTDSYHTDPARRIVLYQWDFHYDGVNFDVEATGATPTYASGYTITNGTDTQNFTVALRVTDDNTPAISKMDTLTVLVTNGNVAPIANAGGPYLGAVGANITLNGSASYDNNSQTGSNPIVNPATLSGFDEIVRYQWDINGNGLYGNDDTPAEPETVNPTVNFGSSFIGTKIVGLKVTDSFGRSSAQSTRATTVAVSDLYPVSYQLVSNVYNRVTRLWTVTWRVSIRNRGNAPATVVSATLTPNTIPAGNTLTDGTVSWSGSIDAGEIQLSDDTFSYTYARSNIDLTGITWDITFTDTLGTRHVIASVPQK